jgi:hypothetical protein
MRGGRDAVKTAVQLRSTGGVACSLVGGTPGATYPGKLGPVAVFTPGAIVGYLTRTPAGVTLPVFRTLAVDDNLAAKVPGVAPRVRLLLFVRTAGRVRAVRRLFRLLSLRGIEPADLRDAFYVRVSAALRGRPTDAARVRALLANEERSRSAAAAPQGSA